MIADQQVGCGIGRLLAQIRRYPLVGGHGVGKRPYAGGNGFRGNITRSLGANLVVGDANGFCQH